jgi:hypothetical protein
MTAMAALGSMPTDENKNYRISFVSLAITKTKSGVLGVADFATSAGAR